MGRIINWTPDKYQRLFAATLAAQPDSLKLNYNLIAAMFGEGATYDSIETRYRAIKKQAKALAEEVNSGQRSAVAALTPRKRKAMEQGGNGVQTPDATPKGSGKRVGKVVAPLQNAAPQTPTKRRRVVAPRSAKAHTRIKKEVFSDDETEEEPWSAGEDGDDDLSEEPRVSGFDDGEPVYV